MIEKLQGEVIQDGVIVMTQDRHKINEIIDYLNSQNKEESCKILPEYEKMLNAEEKEFSKDVCSILIGILALNDVWSPKFVSNATKEIDNLVKKHFFSPK